MVPTIKRQIHGESVFIDFSPIQKIDYISNMLLPIGVLMLSYMTYMSYISYKDDKSE